MNTDQPHKETKGIKLAGVARLQNVVHDGTCGYRCIAEQDGVPLEEMVTRFMNLTYHQDYAASEVLLYSFIHYKMLIHALSCYKSGVQICSRDSDSTSIPISGDESFTILRTFQRKRCKFMRPFISACFCLFDLIKLQEGL